MLTLKNEQELQTDYSKGNIILMFTADWCGDCRFIDPFMPEVEEKYKEDFTFVKVDRDEFIDVCSQYDVFGIPSFIALQDGQVVDRFVSKDRKTKEEIEDFLNNVKQKLN